MDACPNWRTMTCRRHPWTPRRWWPRRPHPSTPPPADGGFFGYGDAGAYAGRRHRRQSQRDRQSGLQRIKQQVEWRNFEGSQGAIDFSELPPHGGRRR
ncbi:MAG: hypothetical protein R2838_17985 [Caldilineaceae bacterium]